MDLSQALSVLKLSWDLPWRVFASLSALTTVAGFWIGGSALGFLARAADWAGLDPATSSALHAWHHWLIVRSVIPGLAGLLIEFVALVFAGARGGTRTDSRAPATVLIGASLAAECGWSLAAAGLLAAVLVLWVVAVVVRVIYVARSEQVAWNNDVFMSEERLRRTWFSPLVAVFYVPFAPLAWAVRS